jgi:hypothetical protein
MNDTELSVAIDTLLVARNPRHMQVARAALNPGYYLRAAQHLKDIRGVVIIGTGFPVNDTFETDGPVGAIALYDALQTLGAEPIIACGQPLSKSLTDNYRVLELTAKSLEAAHIDTYDQLELLQPSAIVSIERPGLAADGRYYNMRSEDITEHSAFFDPFMSSANCSTIAIGDGGNEIGMGKINQAMATLDINPSVTDCDELLVADVSNWGAYGLITFLAVWAKQDLLAQVSPVVILEYLSARGSVDGVTRENTLTEDGLEAEEGLGVIQELRLLAGFLY